jgi:hypothetical protein
MSGMPSSERHNFEVDGFDYVLVLSETGNVALALTDGHIANRGWLSTLYREQDPFEKWEDYEPGVELLDDIDIGINAFRLMREVRGRINGWINRRRPSYFIISPNTERKAPIYARISALLARRIQGYQCQQIGQSFYFFRLANSCDDAPSDEPDACTLTTVSG